MTTFAPRRQQPIAAAPGAPLPLSLPVPAVAPASSPAARGWLARLVGGLRARPVGAPVPTRGIDREHDALYRHDEGGWGDDGGWD